VATIAEVRALMKKLGLDETELPGNLAPGRVQHAEAYLPTPNQLRDDIAAGLDAKTLIRAYLPEVTKHWDDVNTVGLAELENIEAHAAAARNGPVRPVKGIRVKYEPLSFRLKLDLTTPARGGQVSARKIVTTSNGELDALLDRVTDTPDHAAQAVMALRRFDDVLIRVLSARQAAVLTKRPVAEALTLYREEGNLCVFPSKTSLDAGVPSAAPLDHNGRPERTYIALLLRPNLSNLVYLADKTEANKAAGAASVEGLALASVFFTQTTGSDVIGGKWNPVDETKFVDFFGRWSSQNWLAGEMVDLPASAEADARERWDLLKANLSVKNLDGLSHTEPEALRVDPVDPVLMLGLVLTELVAFKRTLLNIDDLVGRPSRPVGENLAAMRYNLQDNPSWALAVMVSAVRSVSAGRVSSPLRQAVNAEPKMKDVVKLARQKLADVKTYYDAHPEKTSRERSDAESEAQVDVATQTDFLDWLLSGNNLQVMEDFLAGAPSPPWTSYPTVRSYGWHHRRLKDFYSRVFPGE
jgi:hypothetical protein